MKDRPIVYVDFPTQYLLTSTLLRFEEHYESPKFAGKVFSWEEFMDWYAVAKGKFTYHCGWRRVKGPALSEAHDKGNFTYFMDWGGFNFPDKVFRPFCNGAFDPLTKKEAAVVQLLGSIQEPFYFIATYGGGKGVVDHEIVHGLFHCNPVYAESVRDVLNKRRDQAKAMNKFLVTCGYGPNVFEDETNAYAVTGWDRDMTSELKSRLEPLRKELRKIFKAAFGFTPGTKAGTKKLMRYVNRIPYSRLRDSK